LSISSISVFIRMRICIALYCFVLSFVVDIWKFSLVLVLVSF